MGGIIKSIFKPPKPPPPPPMPAPPIMAAGSGTAARKTIRQKYSRRKTILTGGQGVEEEAEIAKKTLLGA
tara:strand:+ start:201 stop:410 length:210 start_codon:yes stop_codon:yes gene_type:complete